MPTQLLMQGMEDLVMDDSYQFVQHDGHLPASCILLDTSLTIYIFLNWSLLKNMKETNCYMHIQCNEVIHDSTGRARYNPKRIVNILSLADISKHFCVHFDSANKQAFLVKKADGSSTKHFVLLKVGLYYHNTATKMGAWHMTMIMVQCW